MIPFRVVFGDQEKFRVTVLSGYACCGRGSCRQAFRGHRGWGSGRVRGLSCSRMQLNSVNGKDDAPRVMLFDSVPGHHLHYITPGRQQVHFA